MVLADSFYYQPVQIDTINTRINADLFAKEGDVNGRGLLVMLTENGLMKDTTGISLNLKWDHTSVGVQGLDAFEVVDITKGIYILTYPTSMLHLGKVTAFIQIVDGTRVAGTNNFTINVKPTVGNEEAATSDNSFTALTSALVEVQGIVGAVELVAAEVADIQQQVDFMNTGLGETYDTLIALQTAYPTGDTKDHIVSADGHRYFWNETTAAWTDSGYQSIPLPKDVKSIGEFLTLLKGSMDKVELVTNGKNFVDTTGWTAFNSTQAVVGGNLVITGKGWAYSGSNFYIGAADETGTKYYYRYTMRVRNSGCKKIGIRSSNAVLTNTEISNPTIDVWYTKSGGFTKTAAVGSTTNISPTQYYTNTSGMVLEIAEVNAVNLTALYGAGFEPDYEDFGIMFDSWFVDKLNEISKLPAGLLPVNQQLALLQGAAEVVDIVTNPKDFFAITGWYAFSSTVSAVDGNLLVTGKSSVPYCGVDWRFGVGDPTGTKYFYQYKMRVLDAGCTKIGVRADSIAISNMEIANPIPNQWYTKSGVVEKSDLTENQTNMGLTQYHANVTGKRLEIAEAHIINLTDFYGAGNEPSAEDFEMVYNGWLVNLLKDVTTDSTDLTDLTTYEAVRDEVLWTKQKSSSMDYVFITDPHLINSRYATQMQKIRNAVQMANMGFVDFLCVGGDFINESGYHEDVAVNRDKFVAVSEVLAESKVPVIVLHGNHDDNSTTEFAHTAAQDISQADFYKVFMKTYIGEEFIHDSQKPDSTYFYKDFPSKKMRLIVLDGCDYPVILDGGNYRYRGADWFGYGARQVTWLGTEALVNIPAGYRIVVLSHLGVGSGYNNGKLIEGQLTACHNGATYSGTNSNEDYGLSVNVDFTSQGARPILSFQCGHNHSDSITLRSGGWNVTVTDDCITSDVIDVTTVDGASGKTYFTRMGTGSNRELTY